MLVQQEPLNNMIVNEEECESSLTLSNLYCSVLVQHEPPNNTIVNEEACAKAENDNSGVQYTLEMVNIQLHKTLFCRQNY